MTHNSSAITGIELDQFMDRLEAQQQEQQTDDLLIQLQAQPLQADSLASRRQPATSPVVFPPRKRWLSPWSIPPG